MKIEIKKSLLEQILGQMQPFLEKKDMSLITSHIYLEANENGIEARATDYETGLVTQVEEVRVLTPGKGTANGKKLLDIVRTLKNRELTIETQNDHLIVKQENSKFKLPMFDPEEFPPFPTTDALPKIEIESQTFIDSLKKIAPAIDTNNPKFELNGALIDIKKERINFVATDTRRLAIVTIEKELEKELNLIIPKKAITEIQKIFFDDLIIHYDKNNLIITDDRHLFFTKLINGRYPDYERIIPKSLNYTLTLPKEPMIEAIRQITIISNEIKLTFFDDRIVFENLSGDNIEAQTQIEVQTPFQEPFVMAVNSKYILDFLSHTEGEEFEMGINEADLPFELKEKNFITIVMPIVI